MPSKSNGYGEERQHHPGRQVGRHAFERAGNRPPADQVTREHVTQGQEPPPEYTPGKFVLHNGEYVKNPDY